METVITLSVLRICIETIEAAPEVECKHLVDVVARPWFKLATLSGLALRPCPLSVYSECKSLTFLLKSVFCILT